MDDFVSIFVVNFIIKFYGIYYDHKYHYASLWVQFRTSTQLL